MSVMENFTYNHLNKFLKDKFGERVLKISVNGGFTCPNRDGKCGHGGCIFCGETGGSVERNAIPIKEQIQRHLASYRGERANKFIVYFQNFTNTYGPVEILKQKYDEAVESSDKIVGLAIATRPDCIDEERAKLIASYKDKVYVWVELGFQTANDRVAKDINRGYDRKCFENAVKILNKYGINVVTHIMVGLPGEDLDGAIQTAKYLNKFDLMGIKIHSTYVLENTKLAELYLNKKYTPLELEDYINTAIKILVNLNPKFIIHRISGDAPKERLLAPQWNTHKKLVMNGIENRMKKEGLYQGMKYKK